MNGDAVESKQHGLAMDDELPMPVLEGDLDYPRISVAPVVATSRDQAYAIALAFEAEAAAIVLQFVQPDRATGTEDAPVGRQSRRCWTF